jgi:restriction system protein
MLPLLRLAGDGQEHSIHEAFEKLAAEFHLTEDERRQLLPSGRQAVFDNRVGWARTYLKKADLIESTRRVFFRITERGETVLRSNPARLDMRYLEQFPEYREFRSQPAGKTRVALTTPIVPNALQQTPDEELEDSYQRLRDGLASDLLARVKAASPTFFERLVVELLVNMGYGGSLQDAGQALGRSGDGGIDGIIKEDRLGLDIIYIQAKRWANTVGRPEIQQFVGALGGHHARKGVFIATANFSAEAKEYAARVDQKVVLVDGQQLAQLMIEHNVGVSVHKTYEVKKVDSDYFPEA